MAFCDALIQCHDNVLKYLTGCELAATARTCSSMRHLTYWHDECWKHASPVAKPSSVTWREQHYRSQHATKLMAGRSLPNATMSCGTYVRHVHVYETVVLVITEALVVYVHDINNHQTCRMIDVCSGALYGANFVSAASCGRRTLLTTTLGMVSLVIQGQQAVHAALFAGDNSVPHDSRMHTCFVNERVACMVGSRFVVAHFDNATCLHARSTLVGHITGGEVYDRIVYAGGDHCVMAGTQGNLSRIHAFSWAQTRTHLPSLKECGTIDAMQATTNGVVVIVTSSFNVYTVDANLAVAYVGVVPYMQSRPIATAAYGSDVMVFPYFEQYVVHSRPGCVDENTHAHNKHITACVFTDTHAVFGGCHGELFVVRL